MRPTLILLVGVPGSGKTTYAQKYIQEHPGAIHLSSDSIRKELYGDEAIQGDNNEVFSLMQTRAIDALNSGQSVVYDATNITRKDRSYIIALCPKFAKIECYIIWAPIETCIERDATRERTVGKDVIDKMLKRFQAPYYDEGIDEIKVILPNGFDTGEYRLKRMNDMMIPHDNPHHTLDIYSHCMEANKYLTHYIKNNDDNLDKAAFFHDVGKPYVKAFVDSKGNSCEQAHYYQHHCLGAYMSYGMGLSIETAWLISVHMDPFLNTKYYHKLPIYLKKQVDLLHEADRAAH